MLRSNAATVRSLVRERNSPPPVRSALPEKQGGPRSCVLGRGAVTQCHVTRSLKRWIFPVAVLGRPSTNSTQRGYLNGASRSLTKRCSSSEEACEPGLSTTNAFGLSSWFSSLCATTAASSTEGCATSADSTSAGETHCPPALIMSSERPQ